MVPEAEAIGSHFVNQKILFKFLLQNIDKIKWTTLHVLSNLVLDLDLECSKVKHFAIFWKTI